MNTLTSSELYQQFTIEDLQGLATFGAMPEQLVRKLLEEGDLFELEADETLYKVDSPVDGFYVILSGCVALYHHSHEKVGLTHYFRPGQQIGFVGLIALHPRKGTAVATEKSCILSISTRQYYDLYDISPECFGLLTLNLAREMARTIGDMGDLIAQLRADKKA